MTVRQAIVLAAGRGERLGDATEAVPKALLSLGTGSILSRLANQLAMVGVERLVVVVGYHASLVEDAVRRLGAALPSHLSVELAPNTRWQTQGSATSLLAARERLWRGESFLLAHGDLVVDDAMVAALVSGTRSHVLADTDWVARTDDEVLAWGGGSRLEGVRKGAPDDAAEVGEYVGLVRFDGDVGRAFLDFCTRRTGADPEADYEQPLLHEFVRREPGLVGLTCVSGVAWRNVNHPEDLAWAREHLAHRPHEPST